MNVKPKKKEVGLMCNWITFVQMNVYKVNATFKINYFNIKHLNDFHDHFHVALDRSAIQIEFQLNRL